MFEYFEVNGFRSLKQFKISFEPGLNALVGPNGAGKTNIIDAISFAATVVNGSLTRALSDQGGVGQVFRKEKNEDYFKTMRFLLGDVVSIVAAEGSKNRGLHLAYQYRFSVKLDSNMRPRLTKQRLQVYNATDELSRVKDLEKIAIAPKEWHLDITQASENKYIIRDFNHFNLGLNSFKEQDNNKVKKLLEDRLNSSRWGKESLIELLEPVYYFAHLIRVSAAEINPLAVNPRRVRAGDDIGTYPSLRSDGSGLPSVIHALETGSLAPYSKDKCEQILVTIQDKLSMAVPSVDSVSSRVDRATGKIQLVFNQCQRDGEVVIADEVYAVLASDGTIKWLALIVSLLIHEMPLIEEPENFLHPWMQQEYISLLREQFSNNKFDSIVFTTHSETLLNSLKPSEVHVVSSAGNRTYSRKIRNQKSLQKAIDESGFGLGFHYMTGELFE